MSMNTVLISKEGARREGVKGEERQNNSQGGRRDYDCAPEKLWIQVPFFCGYASKMYNMVPAIGSVDIKGWTILEEITAQSYFLKLFSPVLGVLWCKFQQQQYKNW